MGGLHLRCVRTVFGLMAGFSLLLVVCVPAFSQGSEGSISGPVTDTSGAVIPNATVTVTNVNQGVSRTLTTNADGMYDAPNLTPGNYTIRAEAPGFAVLNRENVIVEVGQDVRVNMMLRPGEQTQSVTVSAAPPMVDTTSATLGGTISSTEIVDLPLNGRNYENLLALRPGVALVPGGGPFTQVTNGIRPTETTFMIDSIINQDFMDTHPVVGGSSPITDAATILPLDSIQEFNVMTNPEADYGWNPGATVNVGIRSGTNDFHGSAYGFYRSSNWDSRDYFNVKPSPNGSCLVGPAITCAPTPAQLKQFGGSLGGPIIKNKLFFFANYEGYRDDIGNAVGTFGGAGVPETVPSAVAPSAPNCPAAVLAVNPTADCAASMVDALNAVIANGGVVSPLTLKLTGCTPGTFANLTATTCTGGYWPHDQTSTAFLSTIPNTNSSNNLVSKIDYAPNEKNSFAGLLIVGRYSSNGEDRGYINPIFANNWTIHALTAQGNWVYAPNSKWVSQFRLGYVHYYYYNGSDDAGLTNPINTSATTPGFPNVSVRPFGTFGTAQSRPQSFTPNPYYDAQENLSYLRGAHTIKFGVEYTHIEADSWIPELGRGQINFSSLEDFFSGSTQAGQFLVGNPTRKMLWYDLATYLQDDWRITPKLTVNLGLRYSYESPIREANNQFANFDPQSPTGMIQQGASGTPTIWKPDHDNFSPRLGLAYDVTGKGTTVVRGGFGLFYETFMAFPFLNQNQLQDTGATSLAANPTGANIVVGGKTLFTGAQNGVAAAANSYSANQLCWDPSITIPGSACGSGQNTVFPSGGTLTCSDISPCNLLAVDPNLSVPYVLEYNLGLEHAFANNLSLEVEYVGNKGENAIDIADINQCAPYDTLNEKNLFPAPSCVRPYGAMFPWLRYINFMSNSAWSNYNGLEVTLSKRLSHGLSFIAGYTYSHSLDTISMDREGLLPRDAFNPGLEYGNSDFNIGNHFTLTGTYNIPGKKGFGQLLEGWQTNTILTVQSGMPWTVNDFGNNFSGTGDSNGTWDFFGNPADFKGAQNSIPYCSGFTVVGGRVDPGGASCTTTTGITNITTTPVNSSTYIANCSTKAPDPYTLAAGGCFANGNSVMVPPVSGTYGTMGRNIFNDSGFWNMDFSVFKSFTWKERYSAQLRLEVFNIFNHPNFANPYGSALGTSGGNNDPSVPALFGGAVATPDVAAGNPLIGSGGARDIQVGLKIVF